MPAIDIDFPCSGSIVPRNFTAHGTWNLDAAGTPVITCVLRNNAGAVTANGTVMPIMGGPALAGTWQANFLLFADHADQTLVAAISGTAANDDQSDITVRESPPLILMPLPVPPPSPPGPPPVAAVNYDISGTRPGGGIAVICIAFLSTAKTWDTILDAVDAKIDAGNPTNWTARLRFDPTKVPPGSKVGVVAVSINEKGKVIGRVARRSIRKP